MRLLKTIPLLLLASTLVFARNARISSDLDHADPSSMVDVIVQFKQPPTAAHHRKIQNQGGVHKRSLDLVNGSLYSVPASALEAIAGDPDVAYIAPDRPVNATGTTGTIGSPDYKLQAVNADIAQNHGWNGAGIGVAIIDSGIQGVTNLTTVVYQQSFVSGGNLVDVYGHGTHVAGIVAGSSNGTYPGVAPKANLIVLRVLDNNGVGSDSTVIAAIQRAIQLKSTYNIKVINLSLGRPVFESYTVDPLCQAVERAWKAGIVVVVAAGNDGRNNSAGTNGYGTITAPGNDPFVITVGAMKTEGTLIKSDDQIASYSSKGPTLFDQVVKPDLVAPGNRIISLDGKSNTFLDQDFPGNKVSGGYFVLSGTSMATPVVSGAAAVLLQQNPNLTPDLVKARLMKTAYKIFPSFSTATDPVTGATYTSQYDIFTVGAGYVDLWAALNNSDTVPAGMSAQSPTVQLNATTGNVNLVTGSTLLWGNTLLWGTSMVWGSNVLVSGSSSVAGQTLLWGANAIQGMHVIWGDSMVWSTSSQTSSEMLPISINGEN